MEENINKNNIIKFILFSAIGVFLFLIPIPFEDSFTIPVGIMIDKLAVILEDYTLNIVMLLVVLNAVLTIIAKVFKPKALLELNWLGSMLDTTPLYVISRILGAIFAIMYFFQIGPEAVISEATGGTMIGLTRSLVNVLLVISFTMPFLTEFGVMEFVGVLIRDVVRPLFLVPGRAAINLITSWLGASNAAVLLTKQQFDTGQYTNREAGNIMVNFSLVSIPFCYIIADILNVTEYFTSFYVILTITGFILAFIMPRLYPLTRLSDEYKEGFEEPVDEEVPEGKSKLSYALELAAERAESAKAEDVLYQGFDMLMSVIFSLSPIIIAWGTVSLILVEYTPFFNILAYPMELYLKLFNIEGAAQAAPATLVGFADMFLPPLILANMESVRTRFIIGALGLIQIIYLTEVGAIILESDVDLDFKDLVIIFLERTILGLPLIVLFTKLFVNF